ncbi:MAG: 30S ribosomal protein S6 [Patescibacteria group bacterium]
MSETTMPAIEAEIRTDEQEIASYELAYHILPTVAEGEVMAVTQSLKDLITKAGGQIFDTEDAERFELAYEIDKYLEGKYRKFNSAYFGWTRFKLAPLALNQLTEHVDEHKQLLRFLLVRLTKVEEANPFRFHEALVDTKVRNIDLDAEVATDTEVVDTEGIVDEVVEGGDDVKIA